MRLGESRVATSDGTTSLTATVTSDLGWFPETEVTIRVDGMGLHDSPAGFVPPLVLLAAVLGEDLAVDGPVSPVLLDGARRAGALYHEWWGHRAPRVTASAVRPTDPASRGAGLWYTRGMDSACTLLLAQRGELPEGQVTHLLGLDWVDPPYDGIASQRQIWADTADAAQGHGLPLLRVSTDIRTLVDRVLDWDKACAPVLSGIGLALAPSLERTLLSSDVVGNDPPHYGSHPQLDPLWATEATRTHHVGSLLDRMAKARIVASDTRALQALKVCWATDTPGNCGRCRKCLLTMTCLTCVDATGWEDVFGAPLSADAIRALTVGPGGPLTREVASAIPDRHVELRDAWIAFIERRRRTPIVVVGDVGGHADYHVGDEAMLAATLELLRELVPDAELIAVSKDPAATAAEYGIRAVPGTSSGSSEAFAALRDAGALVVSGGGNLHRSWPHLVHERVSLGRAARARRTPVFLVGQTIGPDLGPYEEAVGELLRSASFVGVREPTSVRVAADLGVDAHLQLDAAFALAERRPVIPELDLDEQLDGWIAVTVHALAQPDDPVFDRLADELAQVARALGRPVLLIPHVAGDENLGNASDVTASLRLADLLRERVPVRVVGVLPPSEVAWLTRRASLVVSTRYHPIVFGLSAGRPCFGICVDAYTDVKIRGALDLVGLDEWALPLERALDGGLLAALDGLDAAAAHLAALRPELEAWLGRTRSALAASLEAAGLPVSA